MANVEIARLIGHAFGDGSIHNKKHYFIYTNSEIALQKNVNDIVNKEFGTVPMNKGTSISGTPRYQYSNRVGRYLVSYGAPIGSKVLNLTKIPKWILNGRQDVKAAFIGALFDDEGYFRDSSNSRQITFKAAKDIRLRQNLERYLKNIMKVLNSFGIKTSSIRSDQIKSRADGIKMISLRFWITGFENFVLFEENIPILHPQRRQRLLKMVRAG